MKEVQGVVFEFTIELSDLKLLGADPSLVFIV
jgi:hypothetical protein